MKLRTANILGRFLPTISLLFNSGTAFAADSIRIMDDGDPGFTVSNSSLWPRSIGLGYNADFFSAAGVAAGTASWSFSVNPGQYRVSMTWYNSGSPYNLSYSTAGPVSVSAGGVILGSTTANFRTTPADLIDAGVGWKTLGVFNVTSAPLVVTVSAVPGYYVIADAVRIERTDGTPITSPTILNTVPSNSPLSGGIPVIINGTQFSDGMRVLFGTQDSPDVTVLSPTQLQAISPPNPAGIVDLTIIMADGTTGSLPGKFKYAVGRTLNNNEMGFQASSPASTILNSGFQGDYVQPAGTLTATASWNLAVNASQSQAVAVTWPNSGAPYNSVYSANVQFEVRDGANLLATIPASLQTTPADFTDLGVGWKRLGNFTFASGQVNVTLRNTVSKYLLADAIRVEQLSSGAPPPSLTSVSTSSGPVTGGTTLTLKGSSFVSGATVLFGSTSAASVTFNTSGSLSATTPSMSASGPVSVTVQNPDGQKTSMVNAFTFLPIVTVSATDAMAGEPGSGQGTGTFTFTRTGSTSAALTVNFTVAGTATSGTDYTALGTSVTFAAGSATAIATVNVLDDSLIEGTETVLLTLANNSAYIVGTPGSATVTVKDDDFPTVTVAATDPTAGEPGTGQGTGTFTFTRTGPTTSALTVNFSVGGTATSGTDYTALGTSVTFAVGSATATSTVTVLDDTLVEPTETVILTLVSGTGYSVGTPASATVTIQDDDSSIIAIAATDAIAGEPGTGQGTGTFTFTRTGSTTSALTVNFSVGGTATSGTDYTALGTSVTFAAGSATATATVNVIDDSLVEGNETVVVTLASGTGYAVGTPSSATITIQDDDFPTVTVAATDAIAGEPGTGQGTGTFTFTRKGPLSSALTVSFTVGGTATSGTDYSALGTSVSFAAGSATTTATINVIDDTVDEPDETVVVTLANSSAYTVGTPASATVTIKDDDLPTVSIAATDATAGEPGTGQGTGTFTFTRTGLINTALTVSFTVGGTATSGSDYTALGTSVTFAAGSATATATVNVIDDALVEGDETVVLTLAAGVGYTVGAPGSATVTIQDDDVSADIPLVTGFTPGISANNYSGWLGMRLQVGPSDLQVTSLGRIYRTGNSHNHELRLIAMNGGALIASVTWTPAGGVNNQIKYAALATPVTLAANTCYYLASQEASGGDSWYHYNSIVTTTGAADALSAAFSADGVTWSICGVASSTFGPVSVAYRDPPVQTLSRQSLRDQRISTTSTPPVLTIGANNGRITLTWPESQDTLFLEGSPVLGTGAIWNRLDPQPNPVNGQNSVSFPTERAMQFFRLNTGE